MSPSASSRQRGASAVEYALLIALLAAVTVGAVALFGGGVLGLFDGANNSIENAVSP